MDLSSLIARQALFFVVFNHQPGEAHWLCGSTNLDW
tara:strand:+ start:433 stop:540 length:108 start_codon:yes stop_codon:yes gene_type:complete